MAKFWQTLLGRNTPEIARYSLDQYANDISFAFNGGRYVLTGGGTGWSKTEDIEASFTGYINSIYKSNGVVFAIILSRMLLFSEARFCWFDVADNGEDGRPAGREGLEVLERPWPNASTGELLSRMEQDVSLGGNFYAVREPNRLRRLRPDWLTIVLTAPPAVAVESDVAGYWYHPGRVYSNAGEPVPTDEVYLPDEVAHFSPIPDPDAQYRGMSWLTPGVREIMADKAATDHKLNYFTNGATLGVIISAKENLTNAQFKEWKANFEGLHSGTANAYKPLFLASPVDTNVTTATMQQLEFKVTQGAGETRLCAMGGVPPIIVGLSEGLASATYSNYGMARRKFGDGWAHPQWKMASTALGNIVQAPHPDVRLGVNTRGIAFLREDAKDLAEIIQIQASAVNTFITAGYKPDSAAAAVEANDLTLLEHTGLTSVQLQKPGSGDLNGDGQPDAQAQAADQYQQVLESLRAELDDEDDLWRSDLDDEIERKYYDVRVPKGFEGGGRFRSLSDRIGHALNQWLSGDGEHDDPLKDFNRDQLRKASVEFGVTPRRGASAEEIKLGLLTDARARFRAGKAAKSPDAGKPVRFTLKGKDHRNLDVGVFTEPSGKLSLWEVSDSGERRKRVALVDDLAGLESWADEHGESELAGWAKKQGAAGPKAPQTPAPTAPGGSLVATGNLSEDELVALQLLSARSTFAKGGWVASTDVTAMHRENLNALADKGWIQKHVGPDGETKYRIDPRSVGSQKATTDSGALTGDVLPAVRAPEARLSLTQVHTGAILEGYPAADGSKFGVVPEDGPADKSRVMRLVVQRIESVDEHGNPATGIQATHRVITGHDTQTGRRVQSGPVPAGSRWSWVMNPESDAAAPDIEGEIVPNRPTPAPAKVAKAAVPPAPTVRQRLLALPTNDERRQYLTNIGMTQAQSNALAKELGARQTRISVDATIDSIINHFDSSPTEHGGGPPQVAKKAAPSKAVGPEIATVNSMKDLTDLQIKQADHLTSTGRRALDSLGPEGHPRIAAIADTEGKIREAYRMLSGPGAGSGDHYVAFSDVRKLLGDQVSRTDFDDTIRRMVTQPGVRAVPQSYGRSNAAVRIPAAVIMGGQEHDQLHIDDPTLAKPQDFGAVVMAEELQHRRAGRPGDPMMSNLTDAELHTEIAARAARDPVVARDLAAMGFVPASKAPTKKATPASAPDLASLRTLDTESRRDALDLRKVDELKAMLRESGLPVSGRKRELVDRLVEHLDRSDLVTPGTPAAKFAGDYATRRDALHAAHGGEPRITPLEGGISSSVDLLTYPDGIRVVRKDYARSPGRTVGPQSTDRVPADSEELAAQVLNAVGVPAPAVNRVNNHTIDMEFVDGVQGGESGALKAPTTIRDSEQGRLLGLADAIMGHRDRNGGGWMRTADGIVPIDNGNAFEHHRPQAAHGNPFASYLMTANGWKRDLPLDRGDLAGIRTRLEVLRPEFQRLGRQNNFTEMMDRLDGIAANATDRPRLVEHLGGGGSAAPEPLSPAALLASLPSDLTPAQKRARLRSRGVPKAEIDALVPLAKAPSRDFDDLADRVSQLKTADEVYSVLTDLNATELAKLARKFPGGTRRLSSGNEASTSTGLKVPADLSLEDKRRWLAHKLKEWRFHWRSAAPDDDEIERAEVDDTYDDELSPLELEAMAVGEEEPTLDQIRAMAEDDEDDELLRAMAVGDEFEAYWTRGKGLKRWAAKPHPWRTLHRLLLKHPGIHDAEGLASHYFHVVFGIWPGERKGDNPVGPG